jgi:hypothetical protein
LCSAFICIKLTIQSGNTEWKSKVDYALELKEWKPEVGMQGSLIFCRAVSSEMKEPGSACR